MFLPFLRDYVRILPHITTMMHSAYTAGWPVYMMFTFVWQRRWGGLLCGVAALLAVVFLALLGYYIYDHHAARKARAQRDIEKALVQQVRPQAASTAHPANLSSMQDKLDKTMAQTASHAGVCNLLFTQDVAMCSAGWWRHRRQQGRLVHSESRHPGSFKGAYSGPQARLFRLPALGVP